MNDYAITERAKFLLRTRGRTLGATLISLCLLDYLGWACAGIFVGWLIWA